MYRQLQIPQPYKEDVELMKRGRKRKSTTTTRTKGVNIKNIINISRGGGAGRRRPPVSSPAVNYPYANLFRPQLNEPRSTAVTSASSGEQNNNILASFRKSQEIAEGKLNAKIDDMGSKLQENIMDMGRYILSGQSVREQEEQNRKLKPTQPTTMPPFSPRPLPQYQPPVKKTIKLRRPKPKDDDDEKEE
jgi:hypothetical protein